MEQVHATLVTSRKFVAEWLDKRPKFGVLPLCGDGAPSFWAIRSNTSSAYGGEARAFLCRKCFEVPLVTGRLEMDCW